MQRINEILSRIQSIQTQVERPPVAGGFQALLNNKMDAATRGAAGDASPESPAAPGALAMDTMTPRAGSATVTIGAMLGGSSSLSGVASVGGTYPLIRQVPDGSVMTSAQLSDYMQVNQVEARNGRLESHELLSVSGSWHGNGSLLPPAAQAWELMRSAATQDGINLQAIDTYRTWESQERAYQAHLRGEKTANVLPPGTSRHGAGLAVDITTGTIIEKADREWQWLESNARSFGWHPISNEAWHWEFRGV